MNLSNVSKTAIFTLIIRNIMVKKKIIHDPMATLCLERMIQLASEEDMIQISRMKKAVSGLGYFDAKPNADRVLILDKMVGDYISKNTDCTIINLACGFDTRYWRIDHQNCRYIEVDLPEVVALKKEILKDHISYEIIGCSVLDNSWIDQVTNRGNSNFLIIAEGLLMYFTESEGIKFLQTISQRFIHSQIICDMFPKYIAKGFWKRIIDIHSKKYFGFKIPMEFGFNKPSDIETVGLGFKLVHVVKKSNRWIIHATINK